MPILKDAVHITCPKCGYMVSGRLWRCPGCGGSDNDDEPGKVRESYQNIGSIIIAALGALMKKVWTWLVCRFFC